MNSLLTVPINRNHHDTLKWKTKNSTINNFHFWNVTFVVFMDSVYYADFRNVIIYKVLHLKIEGWYYFWRNRKRKKNKLLVKNCRLLCIWCIMNHNWYKIWRYWKTHYLKMYTHWKSRQSLGVFSLNLPSYL